MRLEAGEAGFRPALTTKVQQSQELSLEKRWLRQLVMQPGHVVEFQLRVDLTIHELQLGRGVGRQLRRRGLDDGPLLCADSLAPDLMVVMAFRCWRWGPRRRLG